MSNIYFTVTGLHHYYGDSFLEKEMIVYLKKEKDNEDKKFIVLAKGPEAYESLIEKGVDITEINLGGMGSKQERSKLYKNISASDSERELFKKIMAQNVHVYIQVVPNMEKVELEKAL